MQRSGVNYSKNLDGLLLEDEEIPSEEEIFLIE